MTQPVRRIDTAFLPTTNMQESIDWFQRLFGFAKGFDSGDGNYVGLYLPDGDRDAMRGFILVRTETIDPDAHIRFNLYADDPEALHKQLCEQNVECTPLKIVGNLCFFEFRDNCGNWVGIAHRKG